MVSTMVSRTARLEQDGADDRAERDKQAHVGNRAADAGSGLSNALSSGTPAHTAMTNEPASRDRNGCTLHAAMA